MEVTGTSEAHQRARKLRRQLTKPERLLWWALKGNKTGFHFRCQHAAGPLCSTSTATKLVSASKWMARPTS